MEDSKRLERIESKIDKLDSRIDTIDITLAGQHVSLKTHIKRSDLLEAKMEPVEKHVAMVNGALKLLSLSVIIFELYKALK